jgi:cytochrome c oxidase subunit 2
MPSRHRARAAATALPGLATAMILAALPACRTSDATATLTSFSAAQRNGLQLVLSSGCVSCHGDGGRGGVGPAWVGLYGSQVQLSDGTTVTADEAYLTESIKHPAAKKPRGSTVIMPPNRLTDAQIADIVAYIESLTR